MRGSRVITDRSGLADLGRGAACCRWFRRVRRIGEDRDADDEYRVGLGAGGRRSTAKSARV